METDKNIVEFGLSNVYIGTYEVNTEGVVSLGKAMKLPGAVKLNTDPSVEVTKFRADNTDYWVNYQNNGLEGTLEMARFPDDFKVEFLGYIKLADGGVAEVKNAKKKSAYLMFQGEGDAESRRQIMYNVALASIKTSHETTQKNAEPQTQSIDITVSGDNATGILKVAYTPQAAGYKELFTNPPKPTLPEGD